MQNNIEYFEFRIPQILKLGFPESKLSLLKDYISLLWKANEELNLVSRKMTFIELIDNHLLDSLLPLYYFPKKINSVADFGSGGGFPGVIYAICFPEKKFYLFEKSPKKQEFLKSCAIISPNIIVSGEIPIELINIDLVISRAFKPIDVILDMSRRYYLNGGRYFLLKGRLDKINEEVSDAVKKFKDLKLNIQPLNSPVLEVERNLVLIN